MYERLTLISQNFIFGPQCVDLYRISGSIPMHLCVCWCEYVYVSCMSWRHHEFFITVTSWWIQWRLKSPASRLFTQLFIQVQIKENIKVPRHWPLNSPVTGEFPAQMASNAENVFIWWRHHVIHIFVYISRLPPLQSPTHTTTTPAHPSPWAYTPMQLYVAVCNFSVVTKNEISYLIIWNLSTLKLSRKARISPFRELNIMAGDVLATAVTRASAAIVFN